METYQYDVYGTPLIVDNTSVVVAVSTIGNPYMFTGRRYDPEINLYYYRARMYNPQIGRFMQTDPMGYSDGINWYAYCGNNPILTIDPSGKIVVNLVAGGVGALSGGIIGGVSYAIFNEGNWSWSRFAGSVAGGIMGATLGVGSAAAIASSMSIGAGASAVGYSVQYGTSQGISYLNPQAGEPYQWSNQELATSMALGAATSGFNSQFNYTSHVRGRWPTTPRTSFVGKHAQALYKDAAIAGSISLSFNLGYNVKPPK